MRIECIQKTGRNPGWLRMLHGRQYQHTYGPADALQQWENTYHYFKKGLLLTFPVHSYIVLAGPNYFWPEAIGTRENFVSPSGGCCRWTNPTNRMQCAHDGNLIANLQIRTLYSRAKSTVSKNCLRDPMGAQVSIPQEITGLIGNTATYLPQSRDSKASDTNDITHTTHVVQNWRVVDNDVGGSFDIHVW